MPKFLILVLMVPLLLTAGGCTEKEPVRIGFLGELSGRYADLGLAGHNGALLAVEDWNQRGGLHGRKVALLARDTGSNADGALRAVRELARAGISALIGPMTSQTAMVIKPEIDRLHLVTIGPTIATDRLHGQNDWFFRLYPTTDRLAQRYAEKLYQVEGIRSLTVFIDTSNAAYTQPFYQAFAQTFTSLGGNLAPTSFNSGSGIPFHRLARQIYYQTTDGLLILAGAMDTAMILHQLSSQGYDRPTFATEWSGTEELLTFGGSAVEGLTFYNTFNRESAAPAYLDFVRRYKERFGIQPGFASVHAYDATCMALEALNRDGGDPQQLKKALLNLGSFPGLQARLNFTATGDIERPLFSVRVENGRFRTLP